MALRPLWVATQGLTIGLTPIYRAIQGLWPDDDEDEDEQEIYTFGGGGGGKRDRPRQRDIAHQRYIERQERMYRQNMNLIAIIVAAAAEEFCT